MSPNGGAVSIAERCLVSRCIEFVCISVLGAGSHEILGLNDNPVSVSW